MTREFQVGDVVETIGPNGAGRVRGTVVQSVLYIEGRELTIRFGSIERMRFPSECTLIEEPNNADPT